MDSPTPPRPDRISGLTDEPPWALDAVPVWLKAWAFGAYIAISVAGLIAYWELP